MARSMPSVLPLSLKTLVKFRIVNSIDSVLGRKFCVYCCRGRCYNILLYKGNYFHDSVAEWLRRLTRMHRVIKLEHPASISFGSTGSNPVAVDIVLFLLS